MERSHIKLANWLMAFYQILSSKKGISAHQLHRMLGVSYEIAWFMAHHICYVITQDHVNGMRSSTVEVDETYIGGKEKNKHASKKTSNTQGRSTKTKAPLLRWCNAMAISVR